MKIKQTYRPEDYDHHGQLRAPSLFWFALLIQSRTWWLLIIAAVSRGQGDTLLHLFYPQPATFWLGLIQGCASILGMLLYGHRHRLSTLWWVWRGIVFLSAFFSLLLTGMTLTLVRLQQTPLPLILAGFELWFCVWLMSSQRLKHCFSQ